MRGDGGGAFISGRLVNGRLDSISNPLRASSHLREFRVKLSRSQISREGRDEAKDREGSRINLVYLLSIVPPELSIPLAYRPNAVPTSPLNVLLIARSTSFL